LENAIGQGTIWNGRLSLGSPMLPSEAIAAYRAEFAARPMKKRADNDDQLKQMVAADGMLELPASPAPGATFVRHGSLPNSSSNADEARHLWVVRRDDFPVALEACPWGRKLEDRKIRHSNLTGGSPAHSGGEIWFIGDERIAVNASSGRYGAENEAEFDMIVEALRHSGYHVASMGFDIDNVTIANKIFVGPPTWQAPL
jgi:hypothetical protein